MAAVAVAGVAVDADYGPTTGAWLRDYIDELADANIIAEEIAYSDYVVETKVINHGAICMTGWSTNTGDRVGHSWVVDGVHVLTMITICRIIDDATGFLISETSSPHGGSFSLFHCNYGWGGRCDGYYAYGVFDTTEGPAAGYEQSIGDQNTTQPYNFDQNFTILKYNI